jgi:hypothetical protein
MSASYFWLILLLKIPVIGFVWLVWRALRNADEQQPLPAGDDAGGSKRRLDPHPRPRVPRAPRRGPHGAAPTPTPNRIRSVNARASRACKVGR